MLHFQHFGLMLGMHGHVAQIELVQQLAFIDQHKTHGLAGLDLQGLGVERHIAHDDFNGARGLRRRGRRAEPVGLCRRGKYRKTQHQQAASQYQSITQKHDHTPTR
ncbi:hypothetical protein D3C78_1368740 [compost metagenome]